MFTNRKPSRRRDGFTLLEVVIVGVIVAVVGVMTLSAVTKLRRAARGASCAANLGQIVQALNLYTIDNTGYYPYGYFTSDAEGTTLVSWASSINGYLGSTLPDYSPAFQCPEAQLVGPHPLSYVMNMIVAVTPELELAVGNPPNAQLAPSKTIRMLSFGTALVWDTPVQPDWPEWQEILGYKVGADLDGQRFWNGADRPQYRYFSTNDPFGQIPGNPYGNNRAIVLNVGSNTYFNIDPPTVTSFPYQGNLRFRHGSNNVCNAGFSDGSVRQFTATVNANNTVANHNATRKYFMTHWPPGVFPNPAQPYGGTNPPVRDPGR